MTVKEVNILKAVAVAGLLASAAGLAQAQSAAAPAAAPAAPAGDALSWHGITLYGIVDIGLQNQSHGAPISDYFPAGSSDIVQKNSNHSITGLTPSNMAQSRVGLNGLEPLVGDWSAVFKLETFFNPQSGNISDALKSLVQNNGRPLASQTTGIDSSVAGQPFIQAFAGFSSKSMGTITFGRQNTVLADGIAKYDPNFASQAFSLIGLSGTAAGGGDTQDRRLDSSVKYVATYGGVAHLGAQYKFNGSYGGANSALEISLGGEFAGLSIDGYYAKVTDAVTVSSLSSAQVNGAVVVCPAVIPAGTYCGAGASTDNALAATISDNTTFAVLGLYNFGALNSGLAGIKLYAGYEHIKYANPKTPLGAGFDDIGGYKLQIVNNAAFPSDKVLEVFWAGVRYTVVAPLDLNFAYYGYKQNSYAVGANAGCNTNKSGQCSGTLDDLSFNADYRLTKRFDAYAGVMYTGVKNGLANGYIFHTTDITTTTGVRFKF